MFKRTKIHSRIAVCMQALITELNNYDKRLVRALITDIYLSYKGSHLILTSGVTKPGPTRASLLKLKKIKN